MASVLKCRECGALSECILCAKCTENVLLRTCERSELASGPSPHRASIYRAIKYLLICSLIIFICGLLTLSSRIAIFDLISLSVFCGALIAAIAGVKVVKEYSSAGDWYVEGSGNYPRTMSSEEYPIVDGSSDCSTQVYEYDDSGRLFSLLLAGFIFLLHWSLAGYSFFAVVRPLIIK